MCVLCVGEILWDCLPDGMFPGGAPFNVACHLQQLGIPVYLYTRVGGDERGERLLDLINKKKIDTTFVQTDQDHPTGMVRVQLQRGGIPKYRILTPAAWDFIRFEAGVQKILGKSILVFGSLAQRFPVSRSTLMQLQKSAHRKVFDINLRSPFIDRTVVEESLQGSWLVKLNEQEFATLCRWFTLYGNAEKRLEQLKQWFEIDLICVTYGADGALLFDGVGFYRHQGYRVKVKDTVGAGDAFLAGLIMGLLRGFSPAESLTLANAAGAFVAQHEGAIPDMKADMLLNFLHKGERL